MSGPELADRLEERRVLAGAMDNATMRMVTHYDVDGAGIEKALAAMEEVVQTAKAGWKGNPRGGK